MKCPKCGLAVVDGELFCSECGTQIMANDECLTVNNTGHSGAPFAYSAPTEVQVEVEDELDKDVTVNAPESIFSTDNSQLTANSRAGESTAKQEKPANKEVLVSEAQSAAPEVPTSESQPEKPASDCDDFTIRWNRGASMFLAGTGTSLEFEIIPSNKGNKCSNFHLYLKSPGESGYTETALQCVSIARTLAVKLNFRPTVDHIGVNQSTDLLFKYTKNGKEEWFSSQLSVDIYPRGESADKIIENVNIKIDSITQEGKAGESQLNMLNGLTSSSNSSDDLLRKIKESGALWMDLAMVRTRKLGASQILNADNTANRSAGSLFSTKNITIAAVLINLLIFGAKISLDSDVTSNIKQGPLNNEVAEDRPEKLPAMLSDNEMNSTSNNEVTAVTKLEGSESDTLPVEPEKLVPALATPNIGSSSPTAEHSLAALNKKLTSEPLPEKIKKPLSELLPEKTEKPLSEPKPVINYVNAEHGQDVEPEIITKTKTISKQYISPAVKAKLNFMVKNIPVDFGLNIEPNNNRSTFYNGEKISFNVKADQSCYIAVFVVQADDSVVVLFPNKHTASSLIQSGSSVKIPAESDDVVYIEVSPPFGVDVIQVIACTTHSELHRFIEDMQPNAGNFKVVTRGLTVKMTETAILQSGPAKWATAYTTIVTKEN